MFLGLPKVCLSVAKCGLISDFFFTLAPFFGDLSQRDKLSEIKPPLKHDNFFDRLKIFASYSILALFWSFTQRHCKVWPCSYLPLTCLGLS